MPLFPGESDIDTLHHILKALGNNLTNKQKKTFMKNPLYIGVKLPKASQFNPLDQLVPEMGDLEIDLLSKLLNFNPQQRENAKEFLEHPYFNPIREMSKFSAFKFYRRRVA
jgi:serine/threonine protein kinase